MLALQDCRQWVEVGYICAKLYYLETNGKTKQNRKMDKKILIDNDHWASISFYFSEMSADIGDLLKYF